MPPTHPTSSASPSPQPPKTSRTKTRYKRLGAYVWQHRLLLGGGLISLLLTNQLSLAIPQYIGSAMDVLRADAPDASDQVWAIVWTIIGLAAFATLARVFSRIWVFDAGRRVEFDLRNEVFAHLSRLDMAFFHGMASGDLTSRIANDVNSVRMLCGFAILNIVNTLVAYTTALTRMGTIDLSLTLWCLVPYPLVAFALWHIMRRLFDYTQRTQAQLAVLSSTVQEDVSGIASIKAFGAQPQRRAHFALQNTEYLDLNLALARIRGAMGPVIGALGGIGIMIVLYVGGPRVISGDMSLGRLVEFNAYVIVLSWPTAALAFVLSLWQRGMAGMDRLLDILERAPALQDGPLSPDALPPARGDITLQNVSLSLAGRELLSDVSLSVAPGELVAIVGWTGAGKSTLFNLIARLSDPTSGRVLIDGTDARDFPIDALRRRMGYVVQEPFLFSTTLRQNISFGLTDAAPESTKPSESELARVNEAARIAGLSDDIERFPDKLETIVGERGVTVSGGQKQRLTLARALILKPSILLLDDVLSSVDARTERAIFDALTAPPDGQTRPTVLLTTHRFQGLERMHRIFVLHEGRLIEQGTHADLIAAGGHYARMWQRQQIEESLAAA